MKARGFGGIQEALDMFRESEGLFTVRAKGIEDPDSPLYGKIRHGEKNLLPGQKRSVVIA